MLSVNHIQTTTSDQSSGHQGIRCSLVAASKCTSEERRPLRDWCKHILSCFQTYHRGSLLCEEA